MDAHPGPGSRREPRADRLDAVELVTSTTVKTLFGIGLQVGNDRQHKVQRVGALQDARGTPITAVSVGDFLTHVEGRTTDVDGLQIAEDMILGEEGSVVGLTFRSGAHGRIFEVAARRHVRVRSWDQLVKEFQVRQVLAGQNLSADHTIVQVLNNLRSLISDPSGNPIDLMGGPGNRAELGIVLGKDCSDNLRPLQIARLVDCGPAADSRRIETGDEIMYVDGVAATEDNIDGLLRIGHAVGSRAKLKLQRKGRVFEIQLHRAIAGRFAALGKILATINTHQQSLSQDADTTAAFEAIKVMLMEFSRQRFAQEQTLATSLFELQSKLLDDIESSFELFHPPRELAKTESMPIDHLLARIQQLETELLKSEEARRSQSESFVHLREKLRITKEEVETAAVTRIRLQAELDDAKQDSVPRTEYDSSRNDLLDLHAQISRLQEWKESSVPLAQLDAAQRDHHAQQQRLSGLTEQIAGLKLELANSEHVREEVRIYKQKLQDMKAVMDTMIPRDDLASSESAKSLLQKELSDVRAAMVSQEEHDVVWAERDQLRKELNAWKTKSSSMVSQSALELAKEEEKQLQAQVDRLNKKVKLLVSREDHNAALQNVSSLEDQNKMLSSKSKELEAELAAFKTTVQSSMVPRKDLEDMEARFREMRDKKTALQKDLDSKIKQAKDSRSESESLEAKLRMASDKLAKTSQDLEAQRLTSKTLQGQLDESEVQLRAKAKTYKELSESLARAERGKKDMELALQKTVGENAYVEMQNEVAAQRIECEVKKRELAAVHEENEQLHKTNTQLAARIVQGFWRRMNVQTVPMIKYHKVLEDASDAKQTLSLEKTQREALESRCATLQLKVHELNNEIADLKSASEGSTSKSQLLVANQELERMREELSAKDKELSNGAEIAAGTAKKLRAAEAALEEVKTTSVARDEHVQTRGKLTDCQAALEGKSTALAEQRDLYAQLQRRFQQLQESYDTANAAAGLRGDLNDALAKIKALDQRNTSLDTEIRQERLKHAEFLKGLQSTNDLRSFRGQIEQLKARLEKSAPKEHLVAAKRSVKVLQDENIFLKTQNGSMRNLFVSQGQIVKNQLKEMEEFVLEASAMVPESEAARLKAHVMQLEDEIASLRQDADQRKKDIADGQTLEADLRAEVGALEARMNDLVQRELWEEAGLEARRLKGEAENLRAEVGAMEKQAKSLRTLLADMVPGADLEEARTALEKTESEMRHLKRLLAQAGLSDHDSLARFLDAVVGPPHHDMAQLIGLLHAIRGSKGCGLEAMARFVSNLDDMSLTLEQAVRLLQALRGPPVRSVHDICIVIQALNGSDEESAWQGTEMMQLLRVMRHHPKLQVAELSRMLEHCNSLQELQRLYDSMCTDPEAHGRDQRSKGGIGLLLEQVSKKEGSGHYVKEVVEGGPAVLDARIRVGDQVMFIDGEEVCSKPLHLVTALLRGVPGSSVEIMMIQADYRKDKRVHPSSLPAVAWYTVTLERQESRYYDIAFAKEVLQLSPSPVEEPAVDLWESFSMGVEDISNVVWPGSVAPEVASRPHLSTPRSHGPWLDASIDGNTHESSAENFSDFRQTPGRFVPTESYITEPGAYRTANMGCDLVAM